MTISANELQRLRAPFPLEAHTVREGHRTKDGKKIRWFAYVQRNEVQDRLEEIFLGEWGTEKPEINVQGKNVSAVVGITIRGVTRWDGGEDDSSEGVKGALTNAFRRTAAYGWHIGRYLYDMDFDIWTESYPDGNWNEQKARKAEAFKKFEGWYKQQFGNKPNPFSGTPRAVVVPDEQPEPLETPPDAISSHTATDPTWYATRVNECWGMVKQYLLTNVYEKNPYAMKGSMWKRGCTADKEASLPSGDWANRTAGDLIHMLEARHDNEQPIAEAS